MDNGRAVRRDVSDLTKMNLIAVHPRPVWGSKSDFIVRAELESFGMSGRAEQLWARRISDVEFEVCCIPFFTYGVALGDRVTTDAAFAFQQISSKCGHRTLRAAVARSDQLVSLHQTLHEWVELAGLPYEWYATGYLAVDLPPDREWNSAVTTLRELNPAGDIAIELD